MPLSFCVCIFNSGVANSSSTSVYEKTFPIKVVQSPTHSTSSGRIQRAKFRCTAREVRCHNNEICDLFLISGWCRYSPLSLSSLFVRRRRRSTGNFWPWFLVVSLLSFTMAAHMPLWGHTEICKYANAIWHLQCNIIMKFLIRTLWWRKWWWSCFIAVIEMTSPFQENELPDSFQYYIMT